MEDSVEKRKSNSGRKFGWQHNISRGMMSFHMILNVDCDASSRINELYVLRDSGFIEVLECWNARRDSLSEWLLCCNCWEKRDWGVVERYVKNQGKPKEELRQRELF